MQTLIVYNSRDNLDDLVLLADGLPILLTGITRAVITINLTVIDSQTSPAAITWPQAVTYQAAAAHAMRFKLGSFAIAPGTYSDCRLVIYDATSPGGLVWSDALVVRVKA